MIACASDGFLERFREWTIRCEATGTGRLKVKERFLLRLLSIIAGLK